MIPITCLTRKLANAFFAFCLIAILGQPLSVGQSSQTPDPTLQERHPRYVLQREDVLSLTFPLSPELNQTVTIQPDGYINLQNAGSVYAQGLTTPELVVVIKKAYTGILHDPIIDVDIQDFQKPFFTVSGQVGKPGQYELRADITVAEALAVAGGMTMATAKTQVFLFRRTSQDLFEVKKVNLKDILRGKNVNEDAILRPGDMIYVPEKFIAEFRKYVPYSLNAGTYLSQSAF
ncbi:MAG: polysaccharide biosynthesis/export family protein [Terracidiphilus sp.]